MGRRKEELGGRRGAVLLSGGRREAEARSARAHCQSMAVLRDWRKLTLQYGGEVDGPLKQVLVPLLLPEKCYDQIFVSGTCFASSFNASGQSFAPALSGRKGAMSAD